MIFYMNNIDVSKFPALARLAPQIASEQQLVKKKKDKTKRIEKTKQGNELSDRISKLFGDPAYYFSFLGVQNKRTAATYLASLRRTKRHARDRIRLIEVLEMIESGNIETIKNTLKTSRLMSKVQLNKDIRDKFLNGKLSMQDIENLFDVNNKKS